MARPPREGTLKNLSWRVSERLDCDIQVYEALKSRPGIDLSSRRASEKRQFFNFAAVTNMAIVVSPFQRDL